MAKKKKTSKPARKAPAGRIVLRTGEALVEADEAWSAAEPEVVIGELDGPVGYALANLIGGQVKGHTRVFAILNSDVQVRPATVMVSKVTVSSEKYIAFNGVGLTYAPSGAATVVACTSELRSCTS